MNTFGAKHYLPSAGVESHRQVAKGVHTLSLVLQEPRLTQHKTVGKPDPLCL